MFTVLSFVLVLGILVLVHELGHFLTARAYGVKVLEFGVGYPPRLLSLRRGETVYSLNLLPLGGFVKLLGEEDPSHPQSLAGKGILTRFVVLGSGAAMNALLPLAIFSLLFMVPHKTTVGDVVVQAVAPNSPAAQAGLKPGDVVLKVDGRTMENHVELVNRVRVKLGANSTWLVRRDKPVLTRAPGGEPGLSTPPPPASSETFQVTVRPRWRPPEGQGPVGVQLDTISRRIVSDFNPPWEAIPLALQRMGEVSILFINEVKSWIIGGNRPQLAGPIGIAQLTGEVARAGWLPLLELTALLSINLAVLNILPIPALDGGRLLFVAIEWVRRGKRISPQREGLVHLVGFVVLISIILIVSYLDISRIRAGESLLR
ncbi:MAG: site-2 protease family protein [Chloroflexi bacterium]|nr:site-2 protease family protein [Chloroflexota bacterium]